MFQLPKGHFQRVAPILERIAHNYLYEAQLCTYSAEVYNNVDVRDVKHPTQQHATTLDIPNARLLQAAGNICTEKHGDAELKYLISRGTIYII
jgi:hypothetical protein